MTLPLEGCAGDCGVCGFGVAGAASGGGAGRAGAAVLPGTFVVSSSVIDRSRSVAEAARARGGAAAAAAFAGTASGAAVATGAPGRTCPTRRGARPGLDAASDSTRGAPGTAGPALFGRTVVTRAR